MKQHFFVFTKMNPVALQEVLFFQILLQEIQILFQLIILAIYIFYMQKKIKPNIQEIFNCQRARECVKIKVKLVYQIIKLAMNQIRILQQFAPWIRHMSNIQRLFTKYFKMSIIFHSLNISKKLGHFMMKNNQI